MRVDLFKAQRMTSRSDPTPSLEILATIEIPEAADLATAALVYGEQGRTLGEALFAHLPGGTIDALLCHMLQKRASLFAVRFDA